VRTDWPLEIGSCEIPVRTDSQQNSCMSDPRHGRGAFVWTYVRSGMRTNCHLRSIIYILYYTFFWNFSQWILQCTNYTAWALGVHILHSLYRGPNIKILRRHLPKFGIICSASHLISHSRSSFKFVPPAFNSKQRWGLLENTVGVIQILWVSATCKMASLALQVLQKLDIMRTDCRFLWVW